LLAFMLRDMTWVIDGLVVFPERMRELVDGRGGIAFSQTVLLALVEAGMVRDDAYRVVQRAAAAAWDDGASFRDEIAKDPEVTARLDAAQVDALFDPERFLSNLGPMFERLEALEVDGS
jgi:adenylosuccinate lyase